MTRIGCWGMLWLVVSGGGALMATPPPTFREPIVAMQWAREQLEINQLGESRWALETARSMAPRSELIQDSLRALAPAIKGEPAPSIWHRVADPFYRLGESEWALWVALGWVGLALLLIRTRWTSRWPLGVGVSVIYGLIWLIGWGGCWVHLWVRWSPRAIVVSDTVMRVAPSVTAEGVYPLYEGEQVTVQGTQGRWVSIRRRNRQSGWIVGTHIWKHP